MKSGLKVVLLLFMVFLMSCSKEHLVVLTEEFPPYNFTRDGVMEGLSTEVVKEIFARAGLSYEFRVNSWKESYETALNTKNCLLFSTSRSASREQLFKWIGPIASANYSIFTLTGNKIEISSIEDLKKYKIGITSGDARETYFLSQGFEIGKNLVVSENNEANLKKLMNKEIDFWPMPDAVANYTVTKTGAKPDEIIKVVFLLEDLSKDGYYLAVNKDTSDSIIKKLQAALDKIKDDGNYDKILQKWGL